jgi:CheY-like chemotaxis protein
MTKEQNRTALYFDDNVDNAESLTDYLTSVGVQTSFVNSSGMSPKEALTRVNTLQPPVVLIDISWIPGDDDNRDGLDAGKEISKRHPVVIISSSTKHEKEAMQYGTFCRRSDYVAIASALRTYVEAQ